MAAFNISVSSDDSTVTLQVSGVFDLSAGFAFWQYCQPEIRQRQTYVFDLGEVNDLRDSGVGWLLTFLHRARRSGMRVDFIGADVQVARRLREVGIDPEPPPIDTELGLLNPEPHSQRDRRRP